jgi:hypothetical protein
VASTWKLSLHTRARPVRDRWRAGIVVVTSFFSGRLWMSWVILLDWNASTVLIAMSASTMPASSRPIAVSRSGPSQVVQIAKEAGSAAREATTA